jgi:peptidoglycan/LPS O-acetylase OafA/YrhL
LGNFYTRRFFRLTPVYYFSIGLYILINGPHLENVWANFLYVQNFIDYDKQAMNWTWTLAVEEQFYLLYPLLLMLIMRQSRPLLWFGLLLASSCLINYVLLISDDWISTAPQSLLAADPAFHAHHFSVIYDNLYTRYGALVCGCIAAYLYHYQRERCVAFFSATAGQALGWFCLSVLIVLMVVPMVSTRFDDYQWLNILYQTFSRAVFSGAISVLILVAFGRGLLTKLLDVLLGNRFWYPIAQLSYSMYLVHVLVVSVVVSLLLNAMKHQPEIWTFPPMQAVWLIFGVSLVLTVLVATIMYLILERPLMNLRK